MGKKKWSISEEKKRAILDRDGWACKYCSKPLTYELIPCPHREGGGVPVGFDRPTFDHVVPQSGGGKHTVENLVACCRSCNSSKGAKDQAEWLKAKA